jgi:signal peptidase II
LSYREKGMKNAAPSLDESGRCSKTAMRSAPAWAIVAIVVLADWASKWFAVEMLRVGMPWPSSGNFPRLRLAFNANLDFGLTFPGGGPIVYTILGVGITALILRVGMHIPARAYGYVAAWGLLLGGCIANVTERVVRGTVTDFVDLGAGSFNVADVALICGALLYASLRFRDGKREEGWGWSDTRWVLPHVLPPSLRRNAVDRT